MSSSRPEFKFPWQYTFLPFFTLLPPAETRVKVTSVRIMITCEKVLQIA